LHLPARTAPHWTRKPPAPRSTACWPRLYYAPPSSELLAQLRVAVTEAPAAGGFLEEPWRALVGSARALSDEAIQTEYDDLFGGVGKPEIFLYGSHYLSGFLNEKPLIKLRDDLAELGLARDEAMSETEDHFACLCEVMRYLIAGDDVAVANLSMSQSSSTTTSEMTAQLMTSSTTTSKDLISGSQPRNHRARGVQGPAQGLGPPARSDLPGRIPAQDRHQTNIAVDGALLHELRMPLGYWEAKDAADDLDEEITKKFKRATRRTTSSSATTHRRAVAAPEEVLRCDMTDTAGAGEAAQAVLRLRAQGDRRLSAPPWSSSRPTCPPCCWPCAP
jgi:TorA maturation chaperone TorD